MKNRLTLLAMSLTLLLYSFAVPSIASSADSHSADTGLAPLAGVPWGSNFDAVKRQFPQSDVLDTSAQDYCKGNSNDVCRTYQVILNEHIVGQLYFKVIFLFDTKAKLNGVNFYLIEPEKYSIDSLRVRYDQVLSLLTQKYGKPLSQNDFAIEERGAGVWTAAGETVWYTPETMIELNAKVSRASSLSKPPYDRTGSLFLVLYRPKSDALDAL